jgi:hypothetical protein
MESYRLPTPPSNPFGILSFQKHSGGTASLACSALRGEGALNRPAPLVRASLLSPLDAILIGHLVSVATKELTRNLSPLTATLTKTGGVGGVMVNQTSDEGCLSPATSVVCESRFIGTIGNRGISLAIQSRGNSCVCNFTSFSWRAGGWRASGRRQRW